MNLNQFKQWALTEGSVAKYDDGKFPGQCVSLVNQYCYRVLGVPASSWGDAKDWPSNPFVNQHFNHVSSPQPGDIGVMGGNYGSGLGHIFIYLSQATILEQNGREPLRASTGNTYPSPMAILRYKGEDMSTRNMTKEEVEVLYIVAVPGRPVDQGFVKGWTGGDLGDCLRTLQSDPSIQSYIQGLLSPGSPEYALVTEQLYKRK